MGKKKKRSGGGGGGGGGGGQQPKPADEGEDKAVGDHDDESSCEKPAAAAEKDKGKDKEKDKGKDKEKAKKAPPPFVTVVLKIDMHCDGCAKRIRGSVRHYPGVEGVAMEVDKGTMTVVGRFDAKKLRDRVAKKTKKKVDLVTNKDGGDQHKGKDDGDGCKKQGAFQVHEYGKPDYMYDYFWLDRVYGCAAKPPPEKWHDHGNKEDKKKDDHHKEDKGKDGNKGCGGGGGGGKGKDDKGGCGDGGKGKDDKGGGGEKGKDDKSCGGGGDKGKGGKDNKKPIVPVVGTVVLKIGAMGLHCDGCMNRVRTKLFKIKGVEQVAMDLAKNQVTVTGTMDIKALPGKLQKKLRRPVDVVPAKDKDKDKDKEGKDKDKDGKQEGGGGNDGKEKSKDKDAATKALTAELELWKTAFYDQQSLLNTELMLSDENPNACSIM